MTNSPLTKTGIHFAVIVIVAKQYKVSIEDIMSAGRGCKEVKEARTVAISLTRQHCPHYNTAEIGWLFSRDYSSVSSACTTTTDRLVRDREFKKRFTQADKAIRQVTY